MTTDDIVRIAREAGAELYADTLIVNGKDATGQQVLDYLFGPYGVDSCSSVNFVIRQWCKDDRTRLQRLNMLWAMPLTILLWPFRYVLYGDGGWSTKTLMGRFMLRVTGYLKHAEDMR